ncbi:MAG: hypothetical protein AB7O63_02090 [Reyranellaceae bacterium]
MAVLRSRNAAVLVKAESTPGAYDAPDTTTGGVLVENPQIGFSPQNVQTNEVTGSLDSEGPLVGGMQCSISFRAYLKGNGVPGTSPEWGKLMEACAWDEVATRTVITGTTFSIADTNTLADSGAGLAALTIGTPIYVSGFDDDANNGEFIVAASAAGEIDLVKADGSAPGLVAEAAGNTITIAYGVAAVAATAGTTIAATAQAPWSATADAYRGMPVFVSGNPVAPRQSQIADYSAGRVATLVDAFGSALDTSTDVGIPAHVLYKPNSSAIPSDSIAVYMDGVVYRFRGCRGTVNLAMTAGGAWTADFQMTGLFESKADAAVPTPTYDGTRPGVWRDSIFSIDRTAVGLSQMALNTGAQTTYPPNPNDAEGFDPPEIVSRAMTCQIDPNAVLVATRDILSDMRAGTSKVIHARLKGGNASRPGARLGVVVPDAFYTGFSPTDRQGIAAEQVDFFPRGKDAGAFIAVW